MTKSAATKLTEQRILKLLANVGEESEEDTKHNIDAFDYNWRQPHYFSRNQLKTLKSFTAKVAQNLTEKFNQLYHSDYKVTISTTNQIHAKDFLEDILEKKSKHFGHYFIAFGTDQSNPSGLVGIPVETAITLAKQLLGDGGSAEDAEEGLSQLEESLLLDVARAAVEAFSDSYEHYNFQPVQNVVKGQMPIEVEDTEELCEIIFKIRQADSDERSEAYFLLPCDELEGVVGKNAKVKEEQSARDISTAMHNYVHKASVLVTARLASVSVSLQEAISLSVGDILLLDKKVSDPIELIVEDKKLFLGRPAKTEGKYSVVITELCSS